MTDAHEVAEYIVSHWMTPDECRAANLRLDQGDGQ